eukprot:1415341-Rhodomonas_salina.2
MRAAAGEGLVVQAKASAAKANDAKRYLRDSILANPLCGCGWEVRSGCVDVGGECEVEREEEKVAF